MNMTIFVFLRKQTSRFQKSVFLEAVMSSYGKVMMSLEEVIIVLNFLVSVG